MRLFFLLVSAMLIASSCGLSAAEKITSDPNVGPPVQEAQPEETDKRLAQKVTCEATHKTVSSILEELTEKTGVSLRAGYNKSDWQVRDRKMNIYSKDTTLAALMNSISRVMKFKWSKEKLKDGSYAYRLYMDRKTLLDEEATRAREEERLAKLKQERRLNALESLGELSDLSPAELAKLRTDNPFKYMIAASGMAKPLSGFFGEVPAVTHALASGQSMDVPGDSLSAQGKRNLMDTLKCLWKLESIAKGGSEAFPEDMGSLIDASTIRVNPNLERMREMQEASFMLGEIKVGPLGRSGVEIPLFDPDSSMAKLIGEMLVSAEETGRPLNDEEHGKEMGEKFMKAVASDIARDAAEEPKVERPDDPALRAKLKIKPKTDALPDVESALAEASKLAVVSDSFGRAFGLPMPRDNEMELGDLLDKIGESYRYDWNKSGGVIEFRDKQWYRKRALQIPEAWLEGWRKALKETGTLGLGDMARICSLSHEQFRENIADDEVLRNGGLPEMFYSARDAVALYGALGEPQRAAVFTEAGLDSRSLTPEQTAQLSKLVHPRNAKYAENLESGLTIKGTHTVKQNGKAAYEFKISGIEGEEPLVWTATAPRYVEPAKLKEQQARDEGKKPEQKP